jgi:hypothetical protein
MTFSTAKASSNANLRTTKANLNVTINVKDYGATGDGTTNDVAAINAAIAALTSHSTLFFPAGKYRLQSSPTGMSSLSYVNITGEQAEIFNDTGSSGGNTLVVDNTCSNFTISNLRFTGNSTVRGNGIHIRMGASNSTIRDCYFQGCSDFGVLVSYGSGGYLTNTNIINCVANATLGDGFHFGSAQDCVIANSSAISTGDDALGIVADYLANPPLRIEVIGFNSYQAGNHAAGGNHGCGIRIVDGAADIHVVGGMHYQPCEAGVYMGRATSTTAYNTRIHLEGVKVAYPLQNASMLGGINCAFSNKVNISGCVVDTSSASGISLLDMNDLTLNGNTVLYPTFRGINSDDGTTTNVASSWNAWTITNNNIIGTPSNESLYFTPASGKTLSNLLVAGNSETGPAAGTSYLFTNRLATAAKIVNNTSMGGRTLSNGGSGLAPTTANNN